MAGIYGGLSNKGRYLENWQETFLYSGTLTDADVGKAVALDTTADRTVKLAGDTDEIIGRLEVVENRVQEGLKTCTVALKFIGWVPKTGTFAVGNGIQGSATAGVVKQLTTGNTRLAKVVAVDNTNNRVFVYFQ